MEKLEKKFYSVKSKRPAIYRSNSSYVNISISNSKIVNVDEEGKALSPSDSNASFNEKTLERGLKLRHVQLIALGGCIGMCVNAEREIMISRILTI